MIKDITLGKYYPTNSIIHQLDPRTKIIGNLVLVISIFLTKSYYDYILLFIISLFIIYISKIPIRFFLNGIKHLRYFLLITIIVQLFLVSNGKVMFKLGILIATFDGLKIGVFLVLRFIYLIVISSILTLTTSPIQLIYGIKSLMSPLTIIKVPIEEISLMMMMVLTFIPIILEEVDQLIKAQISRGAEFVQANYIKMAKSFIPLLIPLLIITLKRSEELAMAMETRGYRDTKYQTRVKRTKYSYKDFIAMSILILYIIIFVLT